MMNAYKTIVCPKDALRAIFEGGTYESFFISRHTRGET